jgi:hypothetical protein
MSTIGIDKKMNPGDPFEWMPLLLPTRWDNGHQILQACSTLSSLDIDQKVNPKIWQYFACRVKNFGYFLGFSGFCAT